MNTTVHTRHICVALVLGLMALGGALAAAPPPTVHTTAGDVVGTAGPIEVFKGIPYAAPPVGTLRWREPQAPAPWTDKRDATRFGNDCAQLPWFVSSGQPFSEDCLFINVWTPERARAARRPVLVWIYGGAFRGGSSAYAMYDGTALAREGVVVVSFNYRVGIFGFFAHPGLSAESAQHASGNYGLLDQLAALRWVRDNIASFGGDPNQVTVFGESAGAASIALLMTSPLAKGLFKGAIMQSPVLPVLPTQVAAEAAGAKLGTDIAALRAMSTDELLAHTDDFYATDPATLVSVPTPTLDGYVLPRQPRVAFRDGDVNRDVGVIVGYNADEGRMFIEPGQVKSVADYESWLRQGFGPHAAGILAANPATTTAEAAAAMSHVLGDSMFASAARRVARGNSVHNPRTFSYVFTRSMGGVPPVPTHAEELPFVFGTFEAAHFTHTHRRSKSTATCRL